MRLLVVKTQLVTNQQRFYASSFLQTVQSNKIELWAESASRISLRTGTGFFCEIYFSIPIPNIFITLIATTL